jgi:hypothetical protein
MIGAAKLQIETLGSFSSRPGFGVGPIAQDEVDLILIQGYYIF